MAEHVPLEELVKEMPEEMKAQVHDFATYLFEKRLREEDRDWSVFSLGEAVRGLEEEPLYTEAGLKERWRSNQESWPCFGSPVSTSKRASCAQSFWSRRFLGITPTGWWRWFQVG